MRKKKEGEFWHRFSKEKPILHQKCLVLYRLPKLDSEGTFLTSQVIMFFASEVKNGEWLPYRNGPPIEFWKPISELPKEILDDDYD